MKNECLKEMYIIPIGEDKLVYFPLYRMAFAANDTAIDHLRHKLTLKSEKALSGFNRNDPVDKIAEILLNTNPYLVKTKMMHDTNCSQLIILPNYKCNFSCTYCYSAEGRSEKVIDNKELLTTLNFFARKAIENDLRIVHISILGGGEPFLSWDRVIMTYNHIHSILDPLQIKITFSITTNASLLNPENIAWIKEHSIRLNISFEILPDVQNEQRGYFEKVSNNIKSVDESEISYTIRSTITEKNVCRMDEMVKLANSNYKHAKKLHFEPVTNLMNTNIFYSDFIKNFCKTKYLAKSYGIELVCSVLRSFNSLRTRFCGGELCLTPEGTFTNCHRSSSIKEDCFTLFKFGDVHKENINIDLLKLKELSERNLFSYKRCTDCFAKWHCAGGCLYQRLSYSDTQMEDMCNFVRQFVAILLLEKVLNEKYIQYIHSNSSINLLNI